MKQNKIEIISRIMNVMKISCEYKDKKISTSLNVTCSELSCLKQYFDCEVLSVKDLAEKLNITSGGVTRIVGSLEKSGILKREMDPNDRRGINVILTSKGRKIVDQLHDITIKYFNMMMEDVPDEKIDIILKGITMFNDIWVENIKKSGEIEKHLFGK